MNFNVEVEVDWAEESLDAVFQERIEKAIVKRVTEQLSEELIKKVSERADKLVTAKTEMLIDTILEQPITITKGWNDKTEYASTFDMVESRMSKLYGERMDASSGKCSIDPYLQKLERYVDNNIKEMLTKVESAIQVHSKKVAKETINKHELIQAIGATIKTAKPNGRKEVETVTIDK